ncbi:MAG: hypothetical protein ACE5HO_09780 [bacterium]
MKNRFESLKTLKSEILDALGKSHEMRNKLAQLEPAKIDENTSEKDLIAIAYYLSGLYSNFEDIFLKVAKEFENKVEEPAKWHAQLLNRMSLDIEDIRLAVISQESRTCLDELRKFCHTFRFSYAFELNWEKMLLAVKQWHRDSQIVYQDIQKFLDFLDKLAAE